LYFIENNPLPNYTGKLFHIYNFKINKTFLERYVRGLCIAGDICPFGDI